MYVFGVGILALVVFVPLQMELSWLPSNAPPVVDPWLVVVLAFLGILAVCVLALFAYWALWGDSGWVERSVANHRRASRFDERSPLRP